MVVGIDFGTTFSGYAFSFKGSETEIKLNKNWGDTLGFSVSCAPLRFIKALRPLLRIGCF